VREEFLQVNLKIRALRVQECEKGTFASDLQNRALRVLIVREESL